MFNFYNLDLKPFKMLYAFSLIWRAGPPKINADNAFFNIIHQCKHFRYRPAQTRKKTFAYKYAKFYNLEPYGTTVPNNSQMEIQILISTKSFSLKNWKIESNWYISFYNGIIDHIDKMNREEKQRKQ